MRIAIPSYKRSQTINEKTLNYLCDFCEVSPKDIDVFVANEEEFKEYKKELKYGVNLIQGVETLQGQRNFIDFYYPKGERVFNIDDDVEGIYIKNGNSTEIYTNIWNLIKIGFNECKKNNTALFGIHPVNNGFFLKNKISTNLRYVVGCSFGQIITHNPLLSVSLEDKEDFERSILYYKFYKSVVRLNMFAPKTKYYTEKGGMQQTRTEERVRSSAFFLAKKFPQYCKLKKSNKGHMEIKLSS